MNPKKTIKKKRFLKEETTLEMKRLLEGEDIDWDLQFDKLDAENGGKILFEDFVR